MQRELLLLQGASKVLPHRVRLVESLRVLFVYQLTTVPTSRTVAAAAVVVIGNLCGRVWPAVVVVVVVAAVVAFGGGWCGGGRSLGGE